MADNKRYFWLKLKSDFFQNDDIQVILSKPNGSEYVVFWLKLLLKAITRDEPGYLRYKENIPYNHEILSTVTNTDPDIVRSALQLFEQIGMIQVLEDSTIWIEQAAALVGTETDVAGRVRKHRELKLLQCNKVKQNSNTELEIELEKEIDLEKDKNSPAQLSEKEKKQEQRYQKYKADIQRVLYCLKVKTEATFQDRGKVRDIIMTRFDDGYTPEDLFDAIIAMSRKWMGDPKMQQYLRPATLFAPSKIDGYIAEYQREDSDE